MTHKEQYIQLTKELIAARKSNEYSEDIEDKYCDALEALWWKCSNEEHEDINKIVF